MKYGAKKDANHKEIMDAIRKCGVDVWDLSNLGCGAPDVIAWVADQWRLIEIKNLKTAYGKRGLNPIQRKWLAQWRGGPVYIITDVDQAIRFCRGELTAARLVTPEEMQQQLLEEARA